MKRVCISVVVFSLAVLPAAATSSDVQFRLVVECKPGLAGYLAPEGKRICVSQDVIIDGTNILFAKPMHDKFSEIVSFTFDKTAQARLSDVSSHHVGGRIAIINHDALVAAPVIVSQISGGEMEVHTPDKKTADDILKQFQDRTLVK